MRSTTRDCFLAIFALTAGCAMAACSSSSGSGATDDAGSAQDASAGTGDDASSAGPDAGPGPAPCSVNGDCPDAAAGDDAGPDASTDGGADAAPLPMPALCASRHVIFYDGFDGTSLDTTKWNTQYPWGGNGCCTLSGNGEQEWYTPGQVQVHDGALHLVAIGQKTNGQPYASGMISSGPTQSDPLKYDFQYGYFEARVKIPAGQGLWPAFWTGNSDLSWPPEIDVMEILGNAPGTWYGTVHYSTSTQNNVGDGTSWQGPDFSQGWHTFGVDWQPGVLVWYIDGVERKRVTAANEVQSKRAYLMADLAVGGNWPGDANATTPLPADYAIDYIIVCQ